LVHQIILIENKVNLLCLVLNDGSVDFYKLSNFSFYQTLKLNSAVSFGLYSKGMNKLVLTT